MNPLIEFQPTVHQSLPFHLILPEHFMPAALHWMEVSRNRQSDIVANPSVPSFSNTLVELEFASRELDIVSSCFYNLNSAETNAEIQSIARELSPLLTEFSNETVLNESLFLKIKMVWDHRGEENLTSEQLRLLQETYEGYVRNGALLQGKDRDRLKEISATLSKTSLAFGENVLKETQIFEFYTEQKADLEGLPDDVIEQAEQLALEKSKIGYVLDLDMPTYISVLKYAEREELRETFYRAYAMRGAKANEYNNQEIVSTIVNERLAKAKLLGFKSHAELTLSKRMAQKPETVLGFLDDLKKLAKPAAEREVNNVSEFALKNGAKLPIKPWDFTFWAEKLKKVTLDLDDALLKPYFKLENVLDGAFQVAHKLFGLSFVQNIDISVYHDDVDAYEVFDNKGNFVSVFYADFFPRTGKRAGAWMTSYRNMFVFEEQEYRPHISIVCNFTKPTSTTPSLLTFNEVTTLFHEFGHALHGMMAKGTYPSLTGTNVYWDFVELPSQILENWCYQPESLKLFARHYLTGEMLPEEYIERIKSSQQFLEAYMTLRQLNFGYLDMAWHNATVPFSGSIVEFERTATAGTQLFDPVEGIISSTAFSHIFQGGYSAGYYSYKWAEVLDADAFERFEEEGIFNEVVAKDFATILSSGGTIPPDELFETFRGRAPKVEALLRRAGIAN